MDRLINFRLLLNLFMWSDAFTVYLPDNASFCIFESLVAVDMIGIGLINVFIVGHVSLQSIHCIEFIK